MERCEEITHGQLFAGIGGFGLAAQWAGIKNIWANEIDPFCCKVLKKNFPKTKVYEKDIREIGKHNLQPVTIISGGFPCQPFSQAGKRQGTDDDRHLWPEMCRIIRELQPTYVIGENVAGLISMDNGETLKEILSNLEDEGYHNEIFSIPACAIGAWHKRERLWIISHANNAGDRTWQGAANENGAQEIKERREQSQFEFGRHSEDVPNTDSRRLERSSAERQRAEYAERDCGEGGEAGSHSKRLGRQEGSKVKEELGRKESSDKPNYSNQARDATDSNSRGQSGQGELEQSISAEKDEKRKTIRAINGSGPEQWAIEPELGRVAHGIPRRVDRLKGLGNAIVPQVAYQLFKTIKTGLME